MEHDINTQRRELIQQILPIFNEIYESQADNSVLLSHNNTSFLKQIAIGVIINFTYDTIKENLEVFYDKIIPIIEAEGLKTSDEQKYRLFDTAYRFKFDVVVPKDEWEKFYRINLNLIDFAADAAKFFGKIKWTTLYLIGLSALG